MTHAPATGRTAAPRPIGWGQLLWGLALVTVGAAWLLDTAGTMTVAYPRLFAAAVIVVGVVVPFVPVHEQGAVVGLGVVLGTVTLLGVLAGAAVDPAVLRGGVGEAQVRPVSAAELDAGFTHGVGDLTVDLRGVALPAGTTRTQARLGMGQLRVWVPDDVTVRYDGSAGIGEVTVLSERRAGVGPSVDGVARVDGSERVLDLDLAVGIGDVEVMR